MSKDRQFPIEEEKRYYQALKLEEQCLNSGLGISNRTAKVIFETTEEYEKARYKYLRAIVKDVRGLKWKMIK